MKLMVKIRNCGMLLGLSFCLASAARAQSQSGVSHSTPLIPTPFVKPASPIILINPTAPTKRTPVLRGSLNGRSESPLTFTKVPGGVVFGLHAQFTNDELNSRWMRSVVEQTAAGWTIHSQAGDVLRLPKDQPSFIAAALAFARQQAAGDWLVDLAADGSVNLAASLQNTQAGMVAVRADIVPQFFLPVYAGGKSLIVDKEVRLRVFSDEIFFDADLEVRFYRTSRNPGGEELAERVGTVPLLASNVGPTSRPILRAPEGARLANIASHLDRLSALAGWIGFFRWALSAEVSGLDDFGLEMRRTAVAVRTPVVIIRADRAAWITGSNPTPPADIPEWMQSYRKRVLAESKQ